MCYFLGGKLGNVGVLGKVTPYFWRREFQQRGTEHYHCLIWIEGAPILKQDGSNQDEVADFIDKHIACYLPDVNDVVNAELRNVVAKYQQHNCTASCRRFRNLKSGKVVSTCRYHFPRPASEETKMSSVALSVKARFGSSGSKKLYVLKRTFQEKYINDYNIPIAMAWGAK